MVQQIVITENEIVDAPGPPSIRIENAGPVGPAGPSGTSEVSEVAFTDITVPPDSTGVFDPDTAYQVVYDMALFFGFDEVMADSIATSLLTYLDPVDPTTLDLLVDNIAKAFVIIAINTEMNGISLSGKEDVGVAATAISNAITALGLGTAAQAAVADFAAAVHNHDGSYSALGHNHSGDYDASGTAAGLVNALKRPDGPRIYAPNTEAEMLALSAARTGDYAFRSDLNTRIFLLTADDASSLGNWQVLRWSDGETITKSAIWAKGDLFVGTGVNTLDRLAAGANGMSLIADNTQSGGMRWGGSGPRIAKTTGESYGLPSSNLTSGVTAVGAMRAFPVWLPAGTIDRIGIFAGTGAVSTWRLGIYRVDSAGSPHGQTPLLDAGTISTNATGSIYISTSQVVTEGVYWLALLCEAYTASPTVQSVFYTQSGFAQPGAPINLSSTGRSQVGHWFTGVPTGAMPTYPALTSYSGMWAGVMPSILVRYA